MWQEYMGYRLHPVRVTEGDMSAFEVEICRADLLVYRTTRCPHLADALFEAKTFVRTARATPL